MPEIKIKITPNGRKVEIAADAQHGPNFEEISESIASQLGEIVEHSLPHEHGLLVHDHRIHE
jgi:multidrug resistance efflux pump